MEGPRGKKSKRSFGVLGQRGGGETVIYEKGESKKKNPREKGSSFNRKRAESESMGAKKRDQKKDLNGGKILRGGLGGKRHVRIRGTLLWGQGHSKKGKGPGRQMVVRRGSMTGDCEKRQKKHRGGVFRGMHRKQRRQRLKKGQTEKVAGRRAEADAGGANPGGGKAKVRGGKGCRRDGDNGGARSRFRPRNKVMGWFKEKKGLADSATGGGKSVERIF